MSKEQGKIPKKRGRPPGKRNTVLKNQIESTVKIPPPPKKRGRKPKIIKQIEAVQLTPEELKEAELVKKLIHDLEYIPLYSEDGYRIRETINMMVTMGHTIEQVKKFLTDGTIPLK